MVDPAAALGTGPHRLSPTGPPHHRLAKIAETPRSGATSHTVRRRDEGARGCPARSARVRKLAEPIHRRPSIAARVPSRDRRPCLSYYGETRRTRPTGPPTARRSLTGVRHTGGAIAGSDSRESLDDTSQPKSGTPSSNCSEVPVSGANRGRHRRHRLPSTQRRGSGLGQRKRSRSRSGDRHRTPQDRLGTGHRLIVAASRVALPARQAEPPTNLTHKIVQVGETPSIGERTPVTAPGKPLQNNFTRTREVQR